MPRAEAIGTGSRASPDRIDLIGITMLKTLDRRVFSSIGRVRLIGKGAIVEPSGKGDQVVHEDALAGPVSNLTFGIVAFIACVFVVGAWSIAIGETRSGRSTTDAWRIYGVQILVTCWMVVPIVLGPPWYQIAMVLTAAAASHEMCSAAKRLGAPVFGWVVIAASTACVLLACLPDPRLWAAFPTCCALALAATPVFGFELKDCYAGAAATLLAIVFPGLCLSFAVRLSMLGNAFGDVVFLYAVLEVNDAFAFLVGRYWGTRKLAPRLSPNKTVAGSAGGIGAAVLGAATLSFLQPGISRWECVGIGGALAILGQIADLTASSIKRQAGIKDYSATADVQGGVLDLYDAFIFCAPIWFAFLSVIR